MFHLLFFFFFYVLLSGIIYNFYFGVWERKFLDKQRNRKLPRWSNLSIKKLLKNLKHRFTGQKDYMNHTTLIKKNQKN